MELAEINEIVKESSLRVPFSTLTPVFRDAEEKLPEAFGTNCMGHAKALSEKLPASVIVRSSNITHAAVVVTLDGARYFADTSLGMASAIEIAQGETETETILGNSILSVDPQGFKFTLKRAAVDFSPRVWIFPNEGVTHSDTKFIKRDWLDFLVYSQDGAEQVYLRRYTGQLKWEARTIDRSGASFAGNGWVINEFMAKAAGFAGVSSEDLKETFERGVSLYHYGQAMLKLETGF